MGPGRPVYPMGPGGPRRASWREKKENKRQGSHIPARQKRWEGMSMKPEQWWSPWGSPSQGEGAGTTLRQILRWNGAPAAAVGIWGCRRGWQRSHPWEEEL